jgi:hypothetical protein
VSVAALIAVAALGGIGSLLAALRRPALSPWIGLAAAIACLVIATRVSNDDALLLGGTALSGSDLLRTIAIAWDAGILALAVVGLATGGLTLAIGPALLGLAATSLALGVDDTVVAFEALAAGSLATIALPALPLLRHLDVLAGQRELRPVGLVGVTAAVGAALAGVAIVAWGASAWGPLGGGELVGPRTASGPSGLGVALAGMAGVVLLRGGAIPVHVWASRFISAVTPLAVPAALPWGAAGFVMVALAWTQVAVGSAGGSFETPERLLVVVLAVGSIVFGGLAALVHDDVEHVIGYSILQDVGIALLAFGALRSDGGAAARDWVVASASLKTVLAGWVALTRWGFGAHGVAELHGWVLRAPVLAAAFLVALVGSVGWPGMAIFDARVALASAALPGPLAVAVVIAGLTPLLALGRLFLTGLGRPSSLVEGAPRDRLGWASARTSGWSRTGPITWLIRTIAGLRRRAGFAGSIALAIYALVALVIAISGIGGTSTAV